MTDDAVKPNTEEGPDYSRAFRRLCHLAALTRDRKVKEALDQLVLTTLVLDESVDPIAAPVRQAIAAYFGLDLSTGHISDALTRLIGAGALVPGQAGRYVPSALSKREIEERARAAAGLEATVRAEWLTELRSNMGAEIPEAPLWAALQSFLASTFREHGVETIALLEPPSGVPPSPETLQSLIASAAADAGLGDRAALLRPALELFFNQRSDSKTRFLSQLLDSTFTFFALTVDEPTAKYLRGSLPALSIFIDTNFIFGLLDLHQNPLNEVSKELIEGVRSGRLQFKLYYHERTLKELDATLFAIGQRLRARRWAQSLSRAALSAGTLSGIELRYHHLNAERPIDPDVFLSRFANIPVILGDLGIEIFRHQETDEEAKERWALAAAFGEQLHTWRPDRKRHYEAVDHDAALWLTVRNQRRPERPTLTSGAIILTVDHLLHRWDRQLARENRISPSTVMPAQLLQLLRPFLPATEDFDARFVESFAIPEFRALVGNYGSTASKVISYLATYSDVPQATATKLLRDEILLQSLRDKPEDSIEFRESVENALVAANAQLVDTNATLVREIASLHRRGVQEPVSPGRGGTGIQGTILGLRDSPGTVLSGHTDTRANLDVRIPAAALSIVLAAIAGGLFLLRSNVDGWSLQEPLQDVVPAAFGGLGVITTVMLGLVAWWGVVKASPDFVSRLLTHRAIFAAVTIGALAVLASLWGIQI